METLETTETLADDSSRKPPESQTLGAPDAPPPVSDGREAESAALELGFQPENPSPAENVPLPETLAPKPAAEAKTLAMPELGQDLGLGFSPEGSAKEGEMGAEESPFGVGDFVWGKIKSHPWWPGQVYDPSRASDHAKMVHRKEHHSVLVAYSGDDSFAWCHPSQLKPFVEEFDQMATQSSSKNFIAAVEAALDEIGRFLESQLTCPCVPEEARTGLSKYIAMNAEAQVGNRKISNYPPSQFLDWVKEVALDVSVANMLRVTMLRSWVIAFGKGCSPSESSVYHRRRRIMELVDKIDLDEPPMDSADAKEEDECWSTGGGAGKGPEVSPLSENAISRRGKKKRSMAALIAEMDLDSVELSDDEEERGKSSRKKKGEGSGKGEDVENDSGVKEEESGSGRRERKKSKYLSPPYTYLSGGLAKCLASSKNSEVKTPRNSRSLGAESLAILKCNCEEFPKEEDEKNSSLSKVATTSTAEILLEFLATAVNPLHLKWNRSARTVRGFFAMFRSSVYSNGAEFDTYRKQLNDFNLNGKLAKRDDGCKSDEGKSEWKRGRKRKNGANGEVPTDVSHCMTGHSEQGKVIPKKKMRKGGVNGEIQVNSDIKMVTVSVEGNLGYKKRKAKEYANVEIVEPISCYGAGQMGGRVSNSKDVTNGTATEVNHEVAEGKLGKRKRKSKDGRSGEARINLGNGNTDSLEEGKSGRNRKKKDITERRNPTALLLTFSPGVSLPSKDDLMSAFSKYGPLLESEIELLNESSSARVMFVKSSDAEKAFNDKAGAYGPPIATCRLRYLSENLSAPLTPISVPKPPLPYIRKSLERMISTLSGTTPPKKDAGTSDGLKPEARDNLVGEMQGLLMKVDKMLNGPAPGTSN